MKQHNLTILILLGLLAAGPVPAADPTTAAAAGSATLPRGTASGYPPAGGKGPGSGRSYRSGTPGAGQGAPQYQGGRDMAGLAPETPATPPAVDRPARDAQRGTYRDWRDYRYRRAPYRGYGRDYGYGYPGYRGLSGGPYRHHRQFGAPPAVPAPPVVPAPADGE